MDLAYILTELWRRRVWVAVALALAVLAAVAATHRIGLTPPSVSSKSYSIGGASTEILVDTPTPAVADLGSNLGPLAIRATIYSRFVTSGAVTEAIARKTGIPASAISTNGPVLEAAEAADPTSAERARDILDEGRGYRIQVVPQRDLPLFSVFAQAPTAGAAAALADGTVAGIAEVVEETQRESGTAPSRRVKIRQLGRARGGTVEGGASKVLAVLVFGAVLVGTCILILVVSSLASAWRAGREGERELAEPDGLPASAGRRLPRAGQTPEISTGIASVGSRIESMLIAAQVSAEEIERDGRSEVERGRDGQSAKKPASLARKPANSAKKVGSEPRLEKRGSDAPEPNRLDP